jgi:secreted trypsin-like serine protease
MVRLTNVVFQNTAAHSVRFVGGSSEAEDVSAEVTRQLISNKVDLSSASASNGCSQHLRHGTRRPFFNTSTPTGSTFVLIVAQTTTKILDPNILRQLLENDLVVLSL